MKEPRNAMPIMLMFVVIILVMLAMGVLKLVELFW